MARGIGSNCSVDAGRMQANNVSEGRLLGDMVQARDR